MNLKDELEDIRKKVLIDIKVTNKILPIDGKEIKDCLMEQINLQSEWEDIVSIVSDAYYRAEQNAERIFSEKFVDTNKKAQAILTASELKHEATADPAYSEAKKLQNKAYGLKKRAEGMLKTIETRKYILKDLSGLIINGTEGYMLR